MKLHPSNHTPLALGPELQCWISFPLALKQFIIKSGTITVAMTLELWVYADWRCFYIWCYSCYQHSIFIIHAIWFFCCNCWVPLVSEGFSFSVLWSSFHYLGSIFESLQQGAFPAWDLGYWNKSKWEIATSWQDAIWDEMPAAKNNCPFSGINLFVLPVDQYIDLW